MSFLWGFAFCRDGEGRRGKKKTKTKKAMRLKLTPWAMLSTMLTHDMQFKELYVWDREREREILAKQTFFTLASNKELLILCVWSGPGNHSSSNLMKVSLHCSQWPHVGQWSYNQSTGNPTAETNKKPSLDQNYSLYLCMFDIFIFSKVKRTSVSDNFSIKDHPHRFSLSLTSVNNHSVHPYSSCYDHNFWQITFISSFFCSW